MAELLQSFPKTSVVPKNIFLVLGATPVLETDADALRKGAFFQEPGSAVLLLPTQKASPIRQSPNRNSELSKGSFFLQTAWTVPVDKKKLQHLFYWVVALTWQSIVLQQGNRFWAKGAAETKLSNKTKCKAEWLQDMREVYNQED